MPPLLFLTLRFMVVSLLLLPWLRLLPWGTFRWLVALSVVMGSLHFGALFYGMEGVAGSTTAVLSLLGVPFSVVLAALVFRDIPGPWRIAGLATSFFGAAMLALGGSDGAATGQGDSTLHIFILLFGFMAWAAGNVIGRRLAGLHPFTILGWMSLMAWPQTLLLTLLMEDNHWQAMVAATPETWAALAYITLGASLTAYGLWYSLLGRHPVSKIAPYGLLPPVIGAIGSVVLLGDDLTAPKIAGGVLTLAGVVLIEVRNAVKSRKKARAKAGIER